MKNTELPWSKSAYIIGSKIWKGSSSTLAADQKLCMHLDTTHDTIHTDTTNGE